MNPVGINYRALFHIGFEGGIDDVIHTGAAHADNAAVPFGGRQASLVLLGRCQPQLARDIPVAPQGAVYGIRGFVVHMGADIAHDAAAARIGQGLARVLAIGLHLQTGQLVRDTVFTGKGGGQRLRTADVRAGIAHRHAADSNIVYIRLAVNIGLILQSKVGIFAKDAVCHIDFRGGVSGQNNRIRSHSADRDIMPLHIAFQRAAIGTSQPGSKLHVLRVEGTARNTHFRAQVHNPLAPHPADTEQGNRGIACAEVRRGVISCPQMEGIGAIGAARACDFGCSQSLDIIILVLAAVLDGGMVHRHVDTAYAHALSMGVQHIGSLGINGDVPIGGRNIVGTGKRYAHIILIFHAGKGGGNGDSTHAHIEYVGFVLALVQGIDGDIFRALDGAACDINIRGSLVDDACIAYTYANAQSASTGLYFNFRAIACLSLMGFEGDILARDIGIIKGYIRIVVRMDDSIRDTGGNAAAHSGVHILLKNVTLLRSRHIDITRSRQCPAYLGMDALLPGIGRIRFVCWRGKTHDRISCRTEVAVRGAEAEEFRTADAERTLGAVHALSARAFAVCAVQVNVDFVFGTLIGARTLAIFIGGIAELGIGDALVDGGDRHIDTHADAAYGHTGYAAVKFAHFFRIHIDILRSIDRAA